MSTTRGYFRSGEKSGGSQSLHSIVCPARSIVNFSSRAGGCFSKYSAFSRVSRRVVPASRSTSRRSPAESGGTANTTALWASRSRVSAVIRQPPPVRGLSSEPSSRSSNRNDSPRRSARKRTRPSRVQRSSGGGITGGKPATGRKESSVSLRGSRSGSSTNRKPCQIAFASSSSEAMASSREPSGAHVSAATLYSSWDQRSGSPPSAGTTYASVR